MSEQSYFYGQPSRVYPWLSAPEWLEQRDDATDTVRVTLRQRVDLQALHRTAINVVQASEIRQAIATKLTGKAEHEAGWAILGAALARIDELEAELAAIKGHDNSPALGGQKETT